MTLDEFKIALRSLINDSTDIPAREVLEVLEEEVDVLREDVRFEETGSRAAL